MSLQIAIIGTYDLFRPTPPVRDLVDARWTPAGYRLDRGGGECSVHGEAALCSAAPL
jgi:hypothetical protein